MADLENFLRDQRESDQRLCGNLASIFAKYNMPDDTDEIDLKDMSIVQNKGTIRGRNPRDFGHAELPYMKRRSGDKTVLENKTIRNDDSPGKMSFCGQSNFEEALDKTFGTDFEPEFVMRYTRGPEASMAQITALEDIKNNIEKDCLESPEPSDAETISSESSLSSEEQSDTEEPTETTRHLTYESSTSTQKYYEADDSEQTDYIRERSAALLEQQKYILKRKGNYQTNAVESSTSDDDCLVLSDDSTGSGQSGATRGRLPPSTSGVKSFRSLDISTDDDVEFSNGVGSERKRKRRKRRNTMESIAKRRSYGQCTIDPCRHGFRTGICRLCGSNHIGSVSRGNEHRQAKTSVPDPESLMSVYNVTRKSIESYSPPEPEKSNPGATSTRERSAMDRDREAIVEIDSVEEPRDYRPLIGPSSRVIKNVNLDNGFGSTYVISRVNNEMQVCSDTETDANSIVESHNQEPVGTGKAHGSKEIIDNPGAFSSNIQQTVRTHSVVGARRDVNIAIESNVQLQAQAVGSREIMGAKRGANTIVKSKKDNFLGAFCDKTLTSYEGCWALQAKSYHIALTDTSEVEETTTTEMDSDSDSGNEADVSFMSEWDERIPSYAENYAKRMVENVGTPKRQVAAVHASSPRGTPNSGSISNFAGTPKRQSAPINKHSPLSMYKVSQSVSKSSMKGVTATVFTPRQKLHLNVKDFLSLPNSPTALMTKSPLQKVGAPSPSHFKQLFDKLKASAEKDKSASHDETHTPPSKPSKQIFRTPTTVPRVKPRKRLDLNNNEWPEVLLIDDADVDNISALNSVPERVGKGTGTNSAKLLKVKSPSVQPRKKFQSFEQLFAEMGGGKRKQKEKGGDGAQLEKKLSQFCLTPPRIKTSSKTDLHTDGTSSNISTGKEKPKKDTVSNVVQLTGVTVGKKEAVPTLSLPVAASSPRKSQQRNSTSTPRKVSSPMPNMLDISVINGPAFEVKEKERARSPQKFNSPKANSHRFSGKQFYQSPKSRLTTERLDRVNTDVPVTEVTTPTVNKIKKRVQEETCQQSPRSPASRNAPAGTPSRERKRSASQVASESPLSRSSFASPRAWLRGRELEPMYLSGSDSGGEDIISLSETLNSTTNSSTTTSAQTPLKDTAHTPSKSTPHRSLFGGSSSRKRKHSSNSPQLSPSGGDQQKKHCHSEDISELDRASPFQPLHKRNKGDQSVVSNRRNVTVSAQDMDFDILNDPTDKGKNKPRKFFSSGSLHDRLAKGTNIEMKRGKAIRKINPVERGDVNIVKSPNYTTLRKGRPEGKSREILSPVMTSLSERLRVKYGDQDEEENERRNKNSSPAEKFRYRNKNTFKTPLSTKLFQQDRNSTDMSETYGTETDSGIYSTTDLSEATALLNPASIQLRSSPARVKSHRDRVTHENLPSKKFYNFDVGEPLRSPVSKCDRPQLKEITRENLMGGANQQPLFQSPVAPGKKNNDSQSDARFRHSNNQSAFRNIDHRAHHSVPAKESMVCEGKGKCSKPVCFVCM